MRTAAFGLAAIAVLFAGSLYAQQAPTKEFGVDMSVASVGFDGENDRFLAIDSPVDVRIGVLTGSPVGFETRFGLAYRSDGDGSLLRFSPALNAVIGMSGVRRHLGPYFTGGVLMDMVRFSDSSDSDSQTQFGVNIGVGNRMEWGSSSAIRTELFVTKKFEKGNPGLFDSDYMPGSLAFGLRLGISFFN